MCSTGRRQAVRPASPNDAAIIFNTVRRELPSIIPRQSGASVGNSRPTQSRNSGVFARWSRLRQYLGPEGTFVFMEIETHRWHPEQLQRRIQMLGADNLLPDFARIAVRDPVELGHQFDRPEVRRRDRGGNPDRKPC